MLMQLHIDHACVIFDVRVRVNYTDTVFCLVAVFSHIIFLVK